MQSKWSEYRLDEVTELISDCPHSTPKWKDNGVIVLRSQHIRNGRLDLTSPSFTDEVGYLDRVKRAIPEAGDLVLTREAAMGEICQIPEGLKCCLGQRMVLLRPDTLKVDGAYLLYAIQSPYLQHQISWNEGTGTTVSNIRIPNIKAFKIPTPELKEQKAIAHILGSLDDKIELNRQMNTTLEAMAQALFKSWFVDFDPVIDNALAAGNPIPDALKDKAAARAALGDARKSLPEDVAGLFPAAFVWTEEMGWIPDGWEVSFMPDVSEFREGPGILAKDFHAKGVPLIRLAGLKNGVSLLDGCNFLDSGKVEKKWSHFRLKKGDILLSTSASLGRVAEVDSSAEGAIPYTGIIGFRPIVNKTIRRFLRHYLTSFKFQEQVKMMGVGSVLNHFGPTHIKKMTMLVPALLIQEAFSSLVSPLDVSKTEQLQQLQVLTKLRDVLLPKLLSGELRIPDAEKLIKEAGV